MGLVPETNKWPFGYWTKNTPEPQEQIPSTTIVLSGALLDSAKRPRFRVCD